MFSKRASGEPGSASDPLNDLVLAIAIGQTEGKAIPGETGINLARAACVVPAALSIPVAAVGTVIAEACLAGWAPFTDKYAVGDVARLVYMAYKSVLVTPSREGNRSRICGQQ